MDTTNEPYEWIDQPNEGWMARKWDWSHSIGCGVATFMYVIPGIIFLIWKGVSRSSFTSQNEVAKKNHEIAFERTRCNYIWSVLHLGGHPKLPYDKRILIGIRPPHIIFYDFRLNELHTVPITSANAHIKTVQTISGGSYVTTTNKLTVMWRENLNGKVFDAEFDLEPFDPKQFIDVLNKYSA